MTREFTEAERWLSDKLMAAWDEAEEAGWDSGGDLVKRALSALHLPWVVIGWYPAPREALRVSDAPGAVWDVAAASTEGGDE